MRSRDRSPHTPVIFLTAQDDDRLSAEQAYRLGAVDYLLKPVVPVILRAKVAGFVELFAKTEQVRRQAERIRQLERSQFEQRLAEEDARLRASEHKFRCIIETSFDAVVLVAADGTARYVSPATSRILGYTAEEFVGRNVFAFMHPADLQKITELFGQLLQQPGTPITATFRYRHQDGSWRWIEGTGTNLLGEPSVEAVVSIFHDITPLRQAEERQHLLAESGAGLAKSLDVAATLDSLSRLLVPAFADYCVVHLRDEGGHLRQVAACHADPGKEELLRELERVYRPDAHPLSRVGRVLRTGQSDLVRDFDLPLAQAIEPPDRLVAIIRELDPRSGLIVPLVARGRILGTIALIQATSDQRYDEGDLAFAEEVARRAGLAVDNARLYRELHEAGRRKDEFLAMLAHELRNPLAPVRTGLHILKSDRADREAIEQARAVMERQVVHMARIVDDLLDVSRITRGKVALREQRLDLARLVRITVEDHHAAFDDAGLAADVDVPEVPLWVQGDPTRLTQVVGNLLQNAVKFTPRGGTVSVGLTADAGRGLAVLAVRDTGAGIEPDMLPWLFEPFTQADRSLDRSRGGLGLGLTLVKGLVELHGGEVRAASDGPGRGAEFVVRLPMQPEPAAITGMPVAPSRAGTKLRILVVEDNRDAADSLRLLLELYGYDVMVAYTGPTGVEAAKAWRPDVVLCDIGLPGMDGYGVVRELRRNPATAQARMIAVTGYASDQDRERSQEAGFDAHLTKPADPAALQDLLARSGSPN